jgi:branched-subunit amino acid transport protein
MSWELVAVIAGITYASRALAMLFLPPLSDRTRALLDRMPPALFAGLAAQALVVPGAGLVDGATLAGAAGALLVTPRRSLLLCLIAGVSAYLAWQTLLG